MNHFLLPLNDRSYPLDIKEQEGSMRRSLWIYPMLVALLAGCGPPSASPTGGVIGATIGSAAPIRAVPFLPMGNGQAWILIGPLVYRVGDSRDSVVVPAGFVTDFASIPAEFQSIFSQLGPYLLPAVVHDYLYWEQVCTRTQADGLFLLAMEEMRVPAVTRGAIYRAVRLPFGQRAWDGNARDRRAGLPKIVPTGVRSPEPLETWPAYRRYLYGSGVRPGDPAQITRAFCRHGDG